MPYAYFARFELRLTRADAMDCSAPGQAADEPVAALARKPYIAKQLAKIAPGALAEELKEYGAWNETELADHDDNIHRILWIAACDIREGA